VTDAETRGQALARLAAGLAGDGDWTGAGVILGDLTREELKAAVAELARMAIARCAEVFPRGMGDEAELAPNWPKCWADWVIEAVDLGEEKTLADLADANPAGSPLASACLQVLLAAAVGVEAEAGT
jgi:hypothetical protein